MNFHEYQAKQLFGDYGIAVPKGQVAQSPDEAVTAAKAIGGEAWMVKAQIHAGGRGKAGGVKFCKTTDDVKAAAAGMLGTNMATYQSAGVALPVNLVLVTEAGEIAKELYLSVLVDRGTQSITYIVSSEGGVNIEQVAAEAARAHAEAAAEDAARTTEQLGVARDDRVGRPAVDPAEVLGQVAQGPARARRHRRLEIGVRQQPGEVAGVPLQQCQPVGHGVSRASCGAASCREGRCDDRAGPRRGRAR